MKRKNVMIIFIRQRLFLPGNNYFFCFLSDFFNFKFIKMPFFMAGLFLE